MKIRVAVFEIFIDTFFISSYLLMFWKYLLDANNLEEVKF